MGLENVLRDIEDRGERRVQEIRESAKEDADELLAEAEETAEVKVEEARERAQADAEPLRRRELLSAEIEAKKARLEAQRAAMDAVRERARVMLTELPEKERGRLLEALVDRADAEVEDAQVYAAEQDEDLVRSLVGDRFAGTTQIQGGIVAEAPDGQVRVDYSYETLLDDVWDDAMQEVSSALEG